MGCGLSGGTRYSSAWTMPVEPLAAPAGRGWQGERGQSMSCRCSAGLTLLHGDVAGQGHLGSDGDAAKGVEIGPLQPVLEARDSGRVGKYLHRDGGAGEGPLDGTLVVLADVLPVAAQGAHRVRDEVHGLGPANVPHTLGLRQVVLQLRLGGRPATDEVEELRVAGVAESRLAAELDLGHHGPVRAEGEVALLAEVTLLGLLLVLGVAVLAAALPRAGPALPLHVLADGRQLSVIAHQHDEHLRGDGCFNRGRTQERAAEAAGQERVQALKWGGAHLL